MKEKWGIKISESNETFWMGSIIGTDHDGQPRIGNVVWVVSWKRRMNGYKEKCLADAQRIVKEHNACLGITDEALEKGVVKYSINNVGKADHYLRMNLMKDFNPSLWAHCMVNSETEKWSEYFMGVKIWEDV